MLWIWLFIGNVWGNETCLGPTLAHRTGRENCWAEFRIDSQRKLCLSHSDWRTWLRSPQAICPNPSGPWKIYRPLQNHSKTQPYFIQKQYVPVRTVPIPFRGWPIVERLRERISAQLTPYDSWGVLRSLFLNENRFPNTLSLLRRMGFVHLTSTSGIHLYVLAQVCEASIRSMSHLCHLPISLGLWLYRICTFILCFIIWILGGARLGMLRPWIVILVRSLARYLGFRWSRPAPLVIALGVEALIATYRLGTGQGGLSNSGRWIYALAVGGGLMGYEYFKRPALTHLGLAVGSWIGVALWEAWADGWIALATPLWSLITLPILCGGIYPLLIIGLGLQELGLSFFTKPLFTAISTVLSGMLENLMTLSLKTGNFWIVSRPALILGAFWATFWILYLRRKKWFHLFIIFGIFILIRIFISQRPFSPSLPLQGALSVEQLDVGQGDTTLVIGSKRSTSTIGLIDTGSKWAIHDEGWLKIFSTRQIRHLDWVALTHLDEDHAGGLLRLARLIPIHCVAIPQVELQTSSGRKYAHQLKQKGLSIQDWDSDCIPYPKITTHHLPDRNHGNPHMGAILVPLHPEGIYLSAGDAGEKAERIIGQWAQKLIHSLPLHRQSPRILKINHHGSRTSTSMDYLNLIEPTEAWLSVGIANSFGHPTAEVLQRLQKLKIPIRRTDQSGILHWSSNDNVTGDSAHWH